MITITTHCASHLRVELKCARVVHPGLYRLKNVLPISYGHIGTFEKLIAKPTLGFYSLRDKLVAQFVVLGIADVDCIIVRILLDNL